EVVAQVAGAMYEDGARTTRRSSLLLVGGSLVLVALVWFGQRARHPVRPIPPEISPPMRDGIPADVTSRPDHRADSSAPAPEEPRYQEAPRVTGDPGP
ncbi:MAG: hypothetical protein AB1555_09595, partial [Nitrospirota bacterium]